LVCQGDADEYLDEEPPVDEGSSAGGGVQAAAFQDVLASIWGAPPTAAAEGDASNQVGCKPLRPLQL